MSEKKIHHLIELLIYRILIYRGYTVFKLNTQVKQ
jgi:hypothetical protein